MKFKSIVTQVLGRLTVRQQLYGGFGILLAIFAVVVTLALDGMDRTRAESDLLASKWLKGVGFLANTRLPMVESRELEVKHSRTEDSSYYAEYEEKIAEANQRAAASISSYQALLSSDAERKLFAALMKSVDGYQLAQKKVLSLGRQKKSQDAAEISDGLANTEFDGVFGGLEALFKFNFEGGRAAAEQATQVYVKSKRNVLILLSVAILLGIVSAFGITRQLVRQLGGEPGIAARTALAIADGDLTTTIKLKRNDSSSMMAAMLKMQDALKSFVAAQQEIARQHESGATSYRMPAEQFQGSYRTMAEDTNALVQAHIDTTMQLLNVTKHYAVGDFSVDMARLPGEKAAITSACQEAKQNLLAIQSRISELSAAAARGDFSKRGDASQFQHGFKEMVVSLNQLMQTADLGLKALSGILGALASGDLTVKMGSQYQGAFGKLAVDANATVDKLAEIVAQLSEAAESINTAAQEIASGNNDLSSRTEEQASSLEETASSMETLTNTVKQNAESVRQATQLATEASDVAVKGGAVVSEVVSTMNSINQSSNTIVDIIGVIDGIAFQTNILALNAAVEAARAGEQGRGFAVVATEVRNLAHRSAQAAKEIKELISDSVSKVGAGTKLVDEAGKTMEQIVSSVKRVTDIMSEIAAASLEQRSGIEQVSSALTQMDDVTQQNAGLMEQAAAAAESLEEQAQVLARAVGVFRVESVVTRGQHQRSFVAGNPESKTDDYADAHETMDESSYQLKAG